MTEPGEIERDGDRATLTFRRRLAHPVDVVWAALTESKHLEQWFCPTEIDGRQGGRVSFDGPKGRPVSGRVLVWDPPRVFEHEWHQPPLADSVVRYELVPDGDATLLTVRHSRFDARHARGYLPGLHAYLDRLAAYLSGADVPDWQTLAIAYWTGYNDNPHPA